MYLVGGYEFMVSFNSTIFFTISSFCYILLLFIVFFGKKKVKNRDNKIYSVIICITLVEVIAELLLCMFASFSLSSFVTRYLLSLCDD